MSVNKPTYEDLLKFGEGNLTNSLNASKQYDDHVDNVEIHRYNVIKTLKSIANKLEQDRQYQYEDQKFDIDVMINISQNYVNSFTNFNKFREDGNEYDKTNITGVETSLKGKYFVQMLKLNKYVYTTSSTNYPCDVDFQAMFLGFYTKQSTALKLLEQLASKKYNYCVINECSRDIIKMNVVDDSKNLVVPEIIDGKYTEFPMAITEKYKHLFAENDPVVYVLIEDPIKEHRDLYEVILSFFQKQ